MQALQTARKEIEHANRNFEAAFNAGDIAAVAELYTENAQFLAPHQAALVGRAAIEAFLAGARDAGVASIALTTLEVEADDDSAVELGRYVMKTADGATADEGHYLVHWKKQDGAWLLHRDMIATDLPASGADG